jgi:protein LSM14
MSLPYVGSKIQLISKSDIRFIGILHSINEKESSISLEQVQSFGTEGRTGDPSREILPMPQLFPLIVFKGSDVKDLSVITGPSHMPPPGMSQMSQGTPPGMSQMNHGMPPGMSQMNHPSGMSHHGMPPGMSQMNHGMHQMNQGMPPGMRNMPNLMNPAISSSNPSVMMPPLSSGYQANTVPPSYWQPEPQLNQSIQNLSMSNVYPSK